MKVVPAASANTAMPETASMMSHLPEGLVFVDDKDNDSYTFFNPWKMTCLNPAFLCTDSNDSIIIFLLCRQFRLNLC